ncbi:MAG: hypothetical protein P4M01_00930 [Acidobacteriota bacterium]|nr:hypothetical protein [Acidobacteriota bacterium]
MNPDTAKNEQDKTPVAVHIAEARDLLHDLRNELGQHPELDEAIQKLELALSALTIQTGGLL